MRALHLLAPALMGAGAALLALGLPREGGEVYFVVVFPVFVLRGPLTSLGAALLFFGGLVGFFSLVTSAPERLVGPGPRPPAGPGTGSGEARAWDEGAPSAPRKETKVGGVLLLGPLPIVFGSDAKVTAAMLVLALLLTVLLLVLYLA